MTISNEDRVRILEEAGTLLKRAASDLYVAAQFVEDDRTDDSELMLDAAMLKSDEANKKLADL